ncbi:MAG: SAM-dependent methyltransferase, partial [Deltaproteobacteria bacterium]|nr:SAM-dependent methyltransferase [Deltaproteobacteria bacterium]
TFFDAQFETALKNGFKQAVIFGAGFDSRAQRFDGINQATRIFELDAPITQQEKRKALEDKGIAIPRSLTFVPLNFNQESLAESLARAGYETGQKTLFLLEGLTMYLAPEAVDQTFRFLQETAGPLSRVVFDFVWARVARQDDHYYGAQDILKNINRTGELWRFFLEEDGLEQFVEKYGFGLADLCDGRELERRYFSDPQGRVLARINASHGLAVGLKN